MRLLRRRFRADIEKVTETPLNGDSKDAFPHPCLRKIRNFQQIRPVRHLGHCPRPMLRFLHCKRRAIRYISTIPLYIELIQELSFLLEVNIGVMAPCHHRAVQERPRIWEGVK